MFYIFSNFYKIYLCSLNGFVVYKKIYVGNHIAINCKINSTLIIALYTRCSERFSKKKRKSSNHRFSTKRHILDVKKGLLSSKFTI